MDLAGRWMQCKTELARRIAREDAEAWLDSLSLSDVGPERVVLGGVPNSFFRTRILTQYREALLHVLAEAFPERAPDAWAQMELHLSAAPAEGPSLHSSGAGTPPLVVGAESAPPTEQLALPGLDTPEPPPRPLVAPVAPGLDPRLTLERFLASGVAHTTLDALREIVRAPGQRFNPLLLCGAAGLGKTHLLQGLGHALAQRSKEQGGPLRVLYGTAERFKQEMLAGIQARRMKPVRERWRAADALLLDDLQFLLVAPRAQEELLHLFDEFLAAGKPVAFAADRLPRGLRGLNETLRSRLEAGLVLELDAPDTETRFRYLLRRAAEDRLNLGEPEAKLLAERLRGSLRQAEGVLVRLAAFGGSGQASLTREWVEHIAAPLLADEESWGAPVVAERIVAAVCERIGIAVRGLQSPSRTPTLVRARQVAALLLKELAGLSYPEMGAWLGHRTPSTLSHSVHTLQQDMGRHPHVQRLVQQIREDLAREPVQPRPPTPPARAKKTASDR
jgi:chromosomal replication initiator protein